MEIVTFNNINDLCEFLKFDKIGKILDDDVYDITDDTCSNDRKLRDAEVLTFIAKNISGNCLEIGTSHGRGTFKIATNLNKTIFTLNALQEQISGKFITHALKKDQIGSFLIKNNIKNYKQYYDDSLNWIIPCEVNNIDMIFIDGCHDEKYVYSDSCKFFKILNKNGFLIWHDFNPLLRARYNWIHDSMSGMEKFCLEQNINKVYHLKNSWMGIYKKV